MTFAALLLLALLGAAVGAGATWVALKAGWGNPRSRVFNSAAIAPTIIAVGLTALALVIFLLGGESGFFGAKPILIEGLAAIVAMLNGGLIAAYLVERGMGR
jgi:hypothetical protein